MDEIVYDSKQAIEFLGITGTYKNQALQRMVRKGTLRGLLLSRKQGYRFHRKALEDALLMGTKK